MKCHIQITCMSRNQISDWLVQFLREKGGGDPSLGGDKARSQSSTIVSTIVLLFFLTYYLKVELHLYNPQHKLVSYLKSKGIVVQAYCPLGSSNSPLFTDEDATAIAQ